MDTKLKALLFSLDNVVCQGDTIDETKFQEVGRLIRYLIGRGITPAIVANHRRSFRDRVDREWGVFPWFIAEDTGFYRPYRSAIQNALDELGVNGQEAAYMGNTDLDMRTAKSGGLLYLNVEWFGISTSYGIKFQTPKDVARFVDIFCLRDSLWFFRANDNGLDFYALSPYAHWGFPRYHEYSRDAYSALKENTGHTDFWIKYLCSSIYFSGIHSEVNYVTPYPGHKAGAGSSLLDSTITAFTNCFASVSYIPDLIIRHQDAPESKKKRSSASHQIQMETIHLNSSPLKRGGPERYASRVLESGKTVLVIDDICTQGYSFESARAFIEMTGASAKCIAFLKTVKKPYLQLVDVVHFDPYKANIFGQSLFPDWSVKAHSYESMCMQNDAPAELTARLQSYDIWEWPRELL